MIAEVFCLMLMAQFKTQKFTFFAPRIVIFEKIARNVWLFLLKSVTLQPLINQTPAEIAQLVEHNLAKVRVASSSLVFRSRSLEWWNR